MARRDRTTAAITLTKPSTDADFELARLLGLDQQQFRATARFAQAAAEQRDRGAVAWVRRIVLRECHRLDRVPPPAAPATPRNSTPVPAPIVAAEQQFELEAQRRLAAKQRPAPPIDTAAADDDRLIAELQGLPQLPPSSQRALTDALQRRLERNRRREFVQGQNAALARRAAQGA